MKYINIFLVGFIVLWLNSAANVHDRNAVKAGINNLFNEPAQNGLIDADSLPQYRLVSNTNVVGWLLVINEAQLQNLGVNLSNVTVTKLNNWKTANMDNPNHLKWDRGDSWDAVVATNGLEKVP